MYGTSAGPRAPGLRPRLSDHRSFPLDLLPLTLLQTPLPHRPADGHRLPRATSPVTPLPGRLVENATLVSSFSVEVKTTEREANHFFFSFKDFIFRSRFRLRAKLSRRCRDFPNTGHPYARVASPASHSTFVPTGEAARTRGVDLRVHLGGVRAGGLDTCAATRWHHGVTRDLRGPELPVHPPPSHAHTPND